MDDACGLEPFRRDIPLPEVAEVPHADLISSTVGKISQG